MRSRLLRITLAVAAVSVPARPALAQAPLPADVAPSYAPAALDRIVSPIALYPDPLLAQVLAATTYPPTSRTRRGGRTRTGRPPATASLLR